MERYCIYLRKSRVDIEKGEADTLTRHEAILTEIAVHMKINIKQIYREIVSGDTISARPVMQQLLSEVEQGLWNGVLVMEVERLARGDTIDQGLVSQTFKYSGTKIITPTKTYNPNNEFDEEYFEFGLFMSRREYKTINRRLQAGRIASVKEGNYIGSMSPYGYNKVKNDKNFTLQPNIEQAKVVKMMYDWYTTGIQEPNGEYKRLGTSLIAKRLNELKIPTKKSDTYWNVSSVRGILQNPVYIGKLRWNWRPLSKKMTNGKLITERPRNDKALIVDGLHPALIEKEVWEKVQQSMVNSPPSPITRNKTTQNPFSGLIICGKCGHKMVRRPYHNKYPDTLICPYNHCSNVSSFLESVETRVLESLASWLKMYKIQSNTITCDNSLSEVKIQAIEKLNKEIISLNKQLEKAYDLLEQEVYTTAIFVERSKVLSEKIKSAEKERSILAEGMERENKNTIGMEQIIPKIEYVLKAYYTTESAEHKNNMLKEVLERVVYIKEKGGRWGNPDNFQITIKPKLPINK